MYLQVFKRAKYLVSFQSFVLCHLVIEVSFQPPQLMSTNVQCR